MTSVLACRAQVFLEHCHPHRVHQCPPESRRGCSPHATPGILTLPINSANTRDAGRAPAPKLHLQNSKQHRTFQSDDGHLCQRGTLHIVPQGIRSWEETPPTSTPSRHTPSSKTADHPDSRNLTQLCVLETAIIFLIKLTD